MNFLSGAGQNFIGTVVGGIALVLVFFLFNEYAFSRESLNGKWTFEAHVLASSYNPFIGLKVSYIVLLWQEGERVIGTGEKILEDSRGAKREYVGKNRTRVELEGFVTRNYLRKSTLVLHLTEHGSERDSSTMQSLEIARDRMAGLFESTAANSSGTVRWMRGTSDFSFESLA